MKKPENQILVIFGASGDLTMRKIVPSLFDLAAQNLLPEKFAVVGVGRTVMSDQDFRNKMSTALKTYRTQSSTTFDETIFINSLYYQPIDTAAISDYSKLKLKISDIISALAIPENIIYYMATPPELYTIIPQALAEHGLNTHKEKGGWKRLIIEKPFGTDLTSAMTLNACLHKCFEENQLYRIDHYLGKETVQNILVTRFSNGLFEPLWNRNFIHHIEISSAENIGIEHRGGYYDHAGALRDMVQSHLLQLVGWVAMEPPAVINATSIRNEIVKVFQALRPLTRETVIKNVIQGQYISSVIKGEKIKGYREEDGVEPHSRTETFVAMKLFIDNWRWEGVPFFIRTGKRLPTRVTEIVIHFERPPHSLFLNKHATITPHNQMIIRIQPDEGLQLKIGIKVPGAGFDVQDVNVDFHYTDLDDTYLPSAYERLLLDCMQGDSTLYARADAVETTWAFLQPIIDTWHNSQVRLYGYPAGTWGPNEVAEELIDEPGISWRNPCQNISNDKNYCEL